MAKPRRCNLHIRELNQSERYVAEAEAGTTLPKVVHGAFTAEGDALTWAVDVRQLQVFLAEMLHIDYALMTVDARHMQ